MGSRFPGSPVRGKGNWSTLFCVCLAVILFLNIFVWTPLPKTYDDQRETILKHVSDVTVEHFDSSHRHQPPSLATTKAKNAFVTFLADDSSNDTTSDPSADKYFVAVRILAYQLLHAPETRSQQDIPLVVLVSPHVTQFKRERLQRDGAIIYEAPVIGSDWIKTDVATWAQCMAKLNLLKLTQFDRVAFLDSDTVLTGPLEGVFEDPAVALQTTGKNPKAIMADEAPMPETYSFAAMVEMNHEHNYPPTEEHHDFPNINYLNAGFFVVQPSIQLFDYYLSLTKLENRFDPQLQEQNLLNYAHRPEGNMPWKMVNTKWNIHYPSSEDVRGGVMSLHEKWWNPEQEDLTLYLHSWRWRMEGFFEAKDSA
ncbi:nucleotide-diphospho-sugar transferase [Acrodontium crateriforme]|uniref:Nucleotide-diphospho-sugar transferase n=1 Tax=Acrodontium crateriforme TaxID=150365 RepID=A0AAQ3M027_9PEZI|nr:nucleotide-diphospho-sugar transferase [Acrodontium crateriforme]